MRSLALLLLISLPVSGWAQSSISTYMEGSIIRTTSEHIVVISDDGLYWIDASRPLSHTRHLDGGRIGFWIQAKQIKRFRQVVAVQDTRYPITRLASR